MDDETIVMTALCAKCRTPYPITVKLDDSAQIVDDPLDFADFWLHHWTHEVNA